MYSYPVTLTPDDNGTVLATFPDIPEAATFGDDEADALARAPDAIEVALNGYIADRRPIPTPTAAAGRPVVRLSLLATLKLETYAAMLAKGWRKADLARALHQNPRQVDRLLDLEHATTVPHFEAALAALDRRPVVETRAA